MARFDSVRRALGSCFSLVFCFFKIRFREAFGGVWVLQMVTEIN